MQSASSATSSPLAPVRGAQACRTAPPPAQLEGNDDAVRPHDVIAHPRDGRGRSSVPGLAAVRDAFCPRNPSRSVTPDYIPYRQWRFTDSVATGVAAFASGAAVAGVLGLDPTWGGEAMATFDMLTDQSKQAAAIVSSRLSNVADRNPRAWMLAGDISRHTGQVVTSMSALAPDALLPLTLTGAALSGAGRAIDEAVSANVEVRQARNENLAELRAANHNQRTVGRTLGGLLGLGIHTACAATMGAGLAPALCATAATAAVAASARAVRALDEHPINEDALRRIVDSLERGERIAMPERDQVWRTLTSLTHNQRHVLGRSIDPLLTSDTNFAQLRALYQGRRYLLDLQRGEPYIVLHETAGPTDRLQAMLQAVHIERLRETPEFAAVPRSHAQRWLLEESLHRTQGDLTLLTEEMASAGWQVDRLRFADQGVRAVW